MKTNRVTAAAAALASTLLCFSGPAFSGVRFEITNNAGANEVKDLKFLIFDGRDGSCSTPRQKVGFNGPGTKTAKCRGEGKNRCKVGVQERVKINTVSAGWVNSTVRIQGDKVGDAWDCSDKEVVKDGEDLTCDVVWKDGDRKRIECD